MDLDQYRYAGKKKLQLATWPTTIPAKLATSEIKSTIDKNIKQLASYQDKLYAQSRYGVLIIFQALDAAGKDSMIRHILSGVNPEGIVVNNFKTPSKQDLAHDFLWRVHQVFPRRGQIGVFNRSYYEDVLVTQVHPEILLQENLPGIDQLSDIPTDFFRTRYQDLRHFETYANHCGYMVLKFFLHITPTEQKKRFARRIELPEKNWKFSAADIREAAFWSKYQRIYADVLQHTASNDDPWYIIPSDDKWASRLIVSQIINQQLSTLPLAYPSTSPQRRQELQQILRQLETK
ncbi:polyphosphate kinase 2 family protein [Loigolactobacillus coryniformis]|nr:PPK2 family polyphosphate kinase [Loigolactobacillus coryniformis]MDC4185480.1 polyphosphate kinase 2 family protein [Loigolactobacillus coryniformis]